MAKKKKDKPAPSKEKQNFLGAAIVGEGEDREEVESLIQNKGLQNNVFCLGFSNNPYKILQSGKIVRGGGMGLLVNLIVGIIGGVLGGWLFGIMGIWTTGVIGSLITATDPIMFCSLQELFNPPLTVAETLLFLHLQSAEHRSFFI